MGTILRDDNFVSASDTELKTGKPAPEAPSPKPSQAVTRP
jgi:hypothetical protein